MSVFGTHMRTHFLAQLQPRLVRTSTPMILLEGTAHTIRLCERQEVPVLTQHDWLA